MTRLFALVLALSTTGCAEHWYSEAQAELDLDIAGETLVDARLITPPEAWPREVYGGSLRVTLDGQEVRYVGEVLDGEVFDEARAIDDHWGDNVNVNDAWRDCTRQASCDRTFRFAVACADGDHCSGTFMGDAFLSVELGPNRVGRIGAPMDLSFREVPASAPRVGTWE